MGQSWSSRSNPTTSGILVCGSAQGVCVAANKVRGVRAAAVGTAEEARMTREHNAANVLCLSGWKRTVDEVVSAASRYLDPSRLITLIVGDHATIAESLAALGLGPPEMLPIPV